MLKSPSGGFGVCPDCGIQGTRVDESSADTHFRCQTCGWEVIVDNRHIFKGKDASKQWLDWIKNPGPDVSDEELLELLDEDIPADKRKRLLDLETSEEEIITILNAADPDCRDTVEENVRRMRARVAAEQK